MKQHITTFFCATAAACCFAANPTFTVDASRATGNVSPMLYGLMTEEINHSYDGGLYAELIQNRAFLDDSKKPAHWSAVNSAVIALDTANPFNDKLTTSLKLTVAAADKKSPAGVANEGYWGIPVYPNATYRATIIALGEAGFSGPINVAIVSDDGKKVFASETISGVSFGWKKYEVTLKTGKIKPTAKARFQITLQQPGTVTLALASLFPPTWNDQPNGFRKTSCR